MQVVRNRAVRPPGAARFYGAAIGASVAAPAMGDGLHNIKFGREKPSTLWQFAIFGLVGLGAVLDTLLPYTVNISIIYIAATASCAFAAGRRFVWWVAAAALAATFYEFVDPAVRPGSPLWPVFINRCTVGVTILIVASIVTRLNTTLEMLDQSRADLAAANENLEEEVEARTCELIAEMAERSATEKKLFQSQKMEALGQLSGGVAHDVNNMLGVIIGNLDLAQRRFDRDGEDRYRRFVDASLEAANRAASLIRSLLGFARRAPLDPRPVDINAVLAAISELLRRTLGEQVAIVITNAPGLWRTFVDPVQLESVLLNFAINARDAMPAGGTLTIATGNVWLDEKFAAHHPDVEPGAYVMVTVSDTGVGMPPEVMARVFEPFFTTKEAGGGTGLGLSQAFGFARQSRGHLTAHSDVGVGTTFTLYLPRHRGSDETPDSETAAAPRPERPLQVLLVEDNDGVREFASLALSELGHVTTAAASAEAALALLEARDDFDLLLTDVVMPAMNGRDLAAAALARRPGLKLVYMTGFTNHGIISDGMLAAGTLLLTKPFTVQELVAKLHAAMTGD
ncbi:MAG: ATP-binding protein [Sphingomonadales bacterium]|jgi:signal transduction histidine kinase/ActR/RegA family two-component response regulator